MNLKGRKIIFVAGLHGNEKMPVKALKENNISFVLGNPRALKKSARFIDCDLNSSFGLRNKSYEAKRAKEILKEIGKNDLTVDFHTTTATTAPFVIITDKKMLSLAAKTGLSKVVLMKHNIKRRRALIDYRNGISIEMGNHKSKKNYSLTLKIARNILSGKKYPVKLFEVYGKITEPGHYHNFKKHSGGFIPVLAGEKAYDFYGLKARLIK